MATPAGATRGAVSRTRSRPRTGFVPGWHRPPAPTRPRPRAGRAPGQRRPAARSGPVAFFLVLTCGRRSGRRRPAAAAGRARHRATPTPATCRLRPRAGRAPSRRRPAAAAGRARRRAAPTPATAGHVGELGEHPADAGPLPRLDVPGSCRTCPAPGSPDTCDPLPGLVPWPSSWCSPAAVDLAGPDPLPLLDVLGAGQPRPLRPAGHVGEPGEHLASAGPLPDLVPCPSSWCRLPPLPCRGRGLYTRARRRSSALRV